jgi:putative tricarboxylic transport membrane protein
MNVLQYLLSGFAIVFQPGNLLFCFLGALIGTLVGVLPGIGPAGAIAILLPATYRMEPVSAIILLSGIFYGSMYGGSTTSILVNIPGEAASVVTCLDGYEMAKQGRAGPALGMAAFGSFIAGTLGIVGLMLFARPLSEFGLKFGPPEYFGVILLGMTLITYLSRGSMLKAIMMGFFGLLLSSIGIDPIFGSARLTFSSLKLQDGVGLVPVAMGIFGVGEILINIEENASTEILQTKIKHLFPSVLDWFASAGAILRGTVLGFFVGMLPGGNPVIASFLSYGLEKRVSKTPDRFGKGAVEGVAGPEAANNSATSGAFIPFLTLGIPPSVIMALFMGALLIHGIRPGPLLLKENPGVFWGLVSSMYVGNVMLLILNLPLIPLWVQVLKIPYRILFPLILLFCLIGAYSINNAPFDIILMCVFGIVGYLFRKFGYEGAPLLLAFVLGPMFESTLRQSLIYSKGSFLVFFTRPISAVAIVIAGLLFGLSLVSAVLRSRKGYISAAR